MPGFGLSLALGENTLVVGDPHAEKGKGVVYIYNRKDSDWTITKKIAPDLRQENDLFGFSVALLNNTLVASAPALSVPTIESLDRAKVLDADVVEGAGSIYVFEKTNGTWSEDYKWLQVEQPKRHDGFGTALVLESDRLFASAPFRTVIDGGEELNHAGVVYVFEKVDDAEWVQRDKLIESWEPAEGDRFGASMALDQDTLVVGLGTQPLETKYSQLLSADHLLNEQESRKAVYVFYREGSGVFVRGEKLSVLDDEDLLGFGYQLALENHLLAVSAPLDSKGGPGVNGEEPSPVIAGSGAVVVYVRSEDNKWVRKAYMKAETLRAKGAFGMALSLDKGLLSVGAPLWISNGLHIQEQLQDEESSDKGGRVFLKRLVPSEPR